LDEQAARARTSRSVIVRKALERYLTDEEERRKWGEELENDYRRLQANPELWATYQAENRWWDSPSTQQAADSSRDESA